MGTTFLFVRHLLRGHDLGKDLPLTCTCWYGNLEHFQGKLIHGDSTDMRESTSVFQIRTINWSKLDK